MTIREEQRAVMREKMRPLAARFLERCAGDMLSARELLARLPAGDLDAFEQLERLAHRIRGTGASLGLESLDESARAIEVLSAAHRCGGSPEPHVAEQLAAHAERLERQIALLIRAA